MKLRPNDKHNFEELKRAFANGDVALVDTFDVKDQKQVAMICIVERDGKEYELTPVAALVDYDENVFARYQPPDTKGEIKDKVKR